ncbi:MAG TPA: two-component regulator propeller domain-containing protein [Pyrinomonadaceae bacterium]|nr:two-component regulator propeller domain-containing protein [Pyrinomonadaceae bacterium]
MCLLVFTTSGYSLDPIKGLSEFGRQTWLTENGLPQNTVQAITQTRDGYLWIGTQEGLARFNGVSFRIFDRDNTPQFKSNDVRSLFEDETGTLWISTSYGLIRFLHGEFASFTVENGLPDNSVGPVTQTSDGAVLISTGGGLARYQNGTILALALDNPAVSNVQALFRDKTGMVWIGTASGLLTLHGNVLSNPNIPGEVAKQSINSITQDLNGKIWIGTDAGLVSYNLNSLQIFTVKDGLPDDHVNSVATDAAGCVWLGTTRGLARLNVAIKPNVMLAETLSSNLVLSVLVDREGSLWVGTESGGLNVFRDKKFSTLTTKQGLASDVVKVIYQDKDGSIWIGTNEGLTVLQGGTTKTFTIKDGLSSNVVLSLYGDNNGTLWVGTPDGLNEYKQGRFRTITVAEGLSSDFVRSIYVARDNSVWIGTRNGLNRLKDGVFSTFTTKEGLANDFVGAVYEDSTGTLWIGTRGGLSQYKSDTFTNYTAKQGLSSDVITSLHEDENHDIWVGTNGGGLNRFRNGQFVSYTTRNGLPDNVIYRILEDSQRNLWCSSPRGIFKIGLQELNDFADGKSQTLSATPYGTSDGMLTRECSGGGYPAGWKGSDGKLWFSTIKGVAMIDPNNTQYNRQPPPVAIEQVRIDDRPVTISGPVTLAPGTNRLDFYFSALSFVAPDKVRFKYRLEGFDPAWIDGGTQRAAFYTNLRPGNYTFHVIAANNDGVWNEQGATFQFYLRPHFYQTYWFYALLLLLLGVAAWQLYQLRVRQMRAQFNAVLAERTRIAREIHDNLAQEMLGISVQLEVVARTMPTNAEVARNHLDRVRLLVRHGIAEARRYVWDLRSQALDNADLPTALTETARRLTADQPVEPQVQVSGVFRSLPAGVEDNLLRICQEAINNALTHGKPEHVFVNLTFDIRTVRLSIRDDGRGFDPTEVEKNGHFGLVGIRERAENIGGKLTINSSVENGTEIVVDVPIGDERT